MPRKSQYNVKTGFQQAYDQDFNGTQNEIQLLTGRVTYLEQFPPKENSVKASVTPPPTGNSQYAARQHTH